jgi:heterodisulfide reductase subunit A-like polyferredoxin/coenzyme F420-reducing hydrogenase delta subunit
MANKIKPNARIGVFLCRCEEKIDDKVDLTALLQHVKMDPMITHAETLPFPCMAPGLEAIEKAVESNSLDRVLIAGCEPRILLKKFEDRLVGLGLEKGQVDMVNLRDHVAQANDGAPDTLAAKGAKLISAAAASLNAMMPSAKSKVEFQGPVMILGGGIATYTAAQELLRKEIESIIAVHTDDPDDEIRMLHEHYPGERQYHDRLLGVMNEVYESPLVKKIAVGELSRVVGRTGHYTVTFESQTGKPPLVFECGAIIAALDGQMLNQGADFGHDGKKVLCHTEMEEYLWMHGAPHGQLVFWVNDPETQGRPWADLAARSAWNLANYIKAHSAGSRIKILYNETMKLPLTAVERAKARQLEIEWVPYSSDLRPTVQNGFITYTCPATRLEEELPWDMLCLSPVRSVGVEAIKTAEILGLDLVEGRFLERNPQMVRPEQVGQDEKFLAGSARKPCDLRDSLRQGRRAAHNVAELVGKARAGELYAPRMVCVVDESKCIGCGLCNEICDCGGIEPFEGKGGNVPRKVDPMVCTGGGTCAASCPYQALSLQNNTTMMREARVAALARSLTEVEIMGFGCNWGGGAAADNAGLKGMKHDSRFHMLPVSCLGQMDPCLFGRAFLDGANGLLLLGCPPEECHHSYGIDHTWSRVNLVKKLLTMCGLERERIALAHIDLNRPDQFVRAVDSFMVLADRLGPMKRTPEVESRLKALYNTLLNPRVRWVLGASLRRPYETHYPADQRNAMAYDQTLMDVVRDEFLRARVMNLMQETAQVMHIKDIQQNLGEESKVVSSCLSELAREGAISRIYKDRTPYYVLQ